MGALAYKGKWPRDYNTVPTKLLSVGFKDNSQYSLSRMFAGEVANGASLLLGREPEFLDAIQKKVLRVFLLANHSHLYSFAVRFLLLQTQATFYSFYSVSLYTVKDKGGKPDRKPYPLPYGLRNPYRNLKSENSQDYARKPRRSCTFMNSASG
jgi:hypothetical protein